MQNKFRKFAFEKFLNVAYFTWNFFIITYEQNMNTYLTEGCL